MDNTKNDEGDIDMKNVQNLKGNVKEVNDEYKCVEEEERAEIEELEDAWRMPSSSSFLSGGEADVVLISVTTS